MAAGFEDEAPDNGALVGRGSDFVCERSAGLHDSDRARRTYRCDSSSL